MLETVALIIVGWLLGILAPGITESIKTRHETPQIKKALIEELRQVGFRIALDSYSVNLGMGDIDRSYLRWVRDVVKQNCGDSPQVSILEFVESIEAQLAMSDQDLARSLVPQRSWPEYAPRLKKKIVPLLDARFSSLWSLNARIQMRLLTIRANLDMLNEDIGRADDYFNLTFTQLEEKNLERVNANLDSCYRSFAERARIVVDEISKLQEET